MKFLEKHWWVVIAVLVLWWYAMTNRTTNFAGVTGNPLDSSSDLSAPDSIANFGGADGTGAPGASDSTNTWMQAVGVAALVVAAMIL
jgi:hypothetical protein